MKRSTNASLVLITLLGCSRFTNAAPVLDQQETLMLRPGATTIKQVLEHQVPPDYTVYADDKVKLDVGIRLDPAKPWLEALEQALADVGIAMAANVDIRLIALKPSPRSPASDSRAIGHVPGQQLARLESRGGAAELGQIRKTASLEVVRTQAPDSQEQAAGSALRYHMDKGQPIHLALAGWAGDAGWTLIWYPSVSWKAISAVDIKDKKDVVDAVSEVISILRDEGKAVRLRVSDGNNVMEVVSTEVKND